MPDRSKTLNRLLRVRTLQLGLASADEARAIEKLASEAALRNRIAQLAQGIAPAEAEADAFSFIAAAHYRERLSQSAFAAEARVSSARSGLDRAAAAARDAKRDQSAIEKLIARGQADEALKALRTLENAPAVRRVRHDPC